MGMRGRWLGLIVVAGSASCVQPSATTCDDGSLCPASQVCAPAGGCADPAQVEACRDLADGAACTLTGIGDGTCRDALCTVTGCGDGAVDTGEACDDGNEVSGDGCRADCQKTEACGDGVVDTGEGCDDGPTGLANPADGCDACTATEWTATALLAGAAVGTGTPIGRPASVAIDRFGRTFATVDNTVIRVDPDGSVARVAGTEAAGFAGDGGTATSALLNGPRGLAVDGLGRIFVADVNNNRIRMIDTDGTITTVAGNGDAGGVGDGGPATAAALHAPAAVAVDGLGQLFIADNGNCVIRQVDATGSIATIATTSGCEEADGDVPDLDVDAAGWVYFSDPQAGQVKRFMPGSEPTVVAGSGAVAGPDNGDGGPAIDATLVPSGLAVDPSGGFWVSEAVNNRVRRVDINGVISTIAGTGQPGDTGDGGQATAAQLDEPSDVARGPAATIVIADGRNARLRTVAVDGIIATLAGTGAGTIETIGDGGTSLHATLDQALGIAVDQSGAILVADTGHQRVRRFEPDGLASTIAGTGEGGFGGDGGPATAAAFSEPYQVAVGNDGRLYVTDYLNFRIRRIDVDGTIATIAGNGGYAIAPDGAIATMAPMGDARMLTVDNLGRVYFAEGSTNRVRMIDTAGALQTVAGINSGTGLFAGDGGPATAARLSFPRALAVADDGTLYIGDHFNNRIRRVTPDGIITTVMGTGVRGTTGDGGSATAAGVDYVNDLKLDAEGRLYVAESCAVRRIELDGTVSRIAGAGCGYNGDGGDALAASIFAVAIGLDATGLLYISDRSTVRQVGLDGKIRTVVGLIEPEGVGAAAEARLADPQALVATADLTLFAGGTSGTVEALRSSTDQLEVVAGRYPQDLATDDLARFRDAAFGTVGGVAYDAAAGRIYLSETSADRLHVVDIIDPDDASTWRITALGAGMGFADGALATARFRSPRGLFFDAATRELYVADTGNHVIRAIDVDAGEVQTVAGTPATLGYFGDGATATDALLNGPEALTRCGDQLYVADTGNHRIRRVDAGGVISTVLGDGVAASSGEGAPARTFPVDAPRGLACDAFGNLFVTSSTAVRLLAATGDGIVDGTGAVSSIYGAPPRDAFPANATSCLTGVAVVDGATVQVTDACTGLFIELRRAPI